jgi:hypothetical protein
MAKCEYFYEKQIGVDPNKYWYREVNNDKRQSQWELERQKYGLHIVIVIINKGAI